MIAAILLAIASSFRVGVPAAGQLVTAFTLVYALSSPILTALTASHSHRTLLLGSLGAFLTANLFAAAAPSYWALMGARDRQRRGDRCGSVRCPGGCLSWGALRLAIDVSGRCFALSHRLFGACNPFAAQRGSKSRCESPGAPRHSPTTGRLAGLSDDCHLGDWRLHGLYVCGPFFACKRRLVCRACGHDGNSRRCGRREGCCPRRPC